MNAGEVTERACRLSIAQAAERPIAELTHALTRNPEQLADRFERVRACTAESEMQAENIRFTCRQEAQRLIDPIAKQ